MQSKLGFTIIEVALVLLIFGLIASIGIPRFTRGRVSATDQFIAHLNALSQRGAHQAIKTQRIQKVFFNFLTKQMQLRALEGEAIDRTVAIPTSIEITEFYLDGKNQLAQAAQHYDAYFLINPEGITQEITIKFTDHAIVSNNPHVGHYTIELNPFTARFTLQ